uniref:Putative ixodegrin protein n=1 Tax=Ixodes ricinus TaxID=34613 RepID=A0A0K8RBK4_IXORI
MKDWIGLRFRCSLQIEIKFNRKNEAMKTLSAALALTVVVASLIPEDTEAFEEQKPVLPGFPSRPSHPGKEGEPCNSYRPCRPDLCCLRAKYNRRHYVSTCQPKGLPGQPCSEEAIKGGTYVRHCPCLIGQCPWAVDARCPYLPK